MVPARRWQQDLASATGGSTTMVPARTATLAARMAVWMTSLVKIPAIGLVRPARVPVLMSAWSATAMPIFLSRIKPQAADSAMISTQGRPTLVNHYARTAARFAAVQTTVSHASYVPLTPSSSTVPPAHVPSASTRSAITTLATARSRDIVIQAEHVPAGRTSGTMGCSADIAPSAA